MCKIKNDSTVPPVLLRLYGGNVLPRDAPIRTLNEVTETLLFFHLGETNQGPKLLGTFEGGRIEEFVSGSTLSVDDFVTNPKVALALAKVLAKYHRVNVPVPRKAWDVVNIAKTCHQKFKESYPEFGNSYLTPGGALGEYESLRGVIEFDVDEFTSWIERTMKLIKMRIVFTHNDANRSNIIVKGPSSDLSGQDLDQRLLLIDCEFSGYSYRGFDIGNAFCMRKFDFAGEKFLSGYEYPDVADRRLFIQAYQEDMRRSGFHSDWDEDGIDSIDHILMESEFGAICTRFINIVWCLRDLSHWKSIIEMRASHDPDFSNQGMNSFPNFVKERRNVFVTKWPQFA